MKCQTTLSLLRAAIMLAFIFAVASAFAQPRIQIDPVSFEVDPDEEVEEVVFTIANQGDADLRWTSEDEIITEPGQLGPRRDDAGDLIAEFQGLNAQNEYCSPVAWDWDNEWMWVTRYNRGTAVAYSFERHYENLEEVIRINLGNCMDGAWADGLFFCGALGNQAVNRYNSAGQNIGACNFRFPVYGLATDVDNELIFALSGIDFRIHVYPLDGEGGVGEEIGVIRNHDQYHNNENAYGLEWVSKHPNGQLWMTAATQGRIYQIAVDTDNWTCTEDVQSFVVFQGGANQAYSTVAHDGHNLWAGGYTEETIRVYDDGITETYWLTWEPKEGTIPPGEEVDVIVTLNAAGLYSGDYIADIHILSNDPDNADAVVAIIFHVTGVPDIDVEWPEEAGYPDSINFNSYFNEVFVGGPYPMPLTVTNAGTEDLIVNQISCDNDAFQVEPAELTLRHREDAEVRLVFNANRRMAVNAHLTFASNDPNEQEVVIPLHAEAMNPPRIVVSPTSIEKIDPDPNDPTVINLENDGDSPLRWRGDIEIISENEQVNGSTGSSDERSGQSNVVRDDAGELLAAFRLDHGSATCFDFDPNDSWMWTAHLDPSHITAYEAAGAYNVTNVVFDRRLTERSSAVAFLGGLIYSNEVHDSAIYVFNLDGQLTRTIQLGFEPLKFASSPQDTKLFVLDFQKQIHILDVQQDYQEVGFYSVNVATSELVVRSFCWVDKHHPAELWIAGGSTVKQLRPQLNGEADQVQNFYVQHELTYNAIGHDDYNLWIAYSLNSISVGIYDDGVIESWMALSPDEGVLGSGQVDNLTLSIDPNLTRNFIGHYEAALHFLSNDPADPDVVVSICISWLDAPSDPTETLPKDVALNSAFPNPFNSATTISFSLPIRETVRMAIYNQSGRLIENLIDGAVPSGEHRLSWNAESNPAGVYFCMLEAGQARKSVKLMVVK